MAQSGIKSYFPSQVVSDVEKISYEYDLEYGTDTLELNIDANGKKFLIVDDLLATGGTVIAALDLISEFKDKTVVGAGFVINLPELGGLRKLEHLGIKSKYLFEF